MPRTVGRSSGAESGRAGHPEDRACSELGADQLVDLVVEPRQAVVAVVGVQPQRLVPGQLVVHRELRGRRADPVLEADGRSTRARIRGARCCTSMYPSMVKTSVLPQVLRVALAEPVGDLAVRCLSRLSS